MERPKTPPRATQPAPVVSPPTPAVTRRIEENRLRAKAIRDQHEQARLASGAPGLDKTPSGFIATDNVHIPNSRKRTHADISSSSSSSKAHGPDTVRDARQNPSDDAAPKSLRPARNFTKFRTKAGPFEPSLSVLRDASVRAAQKCRECASPEIDHVWAEVFGLCVCAPCKDRHAHRYSLLTKTECREDYLLTEGELRDADLLPHLNKPNPHKSHWHDMMLFLRCQVEDYAFNTKWGSEEKLDAEFARREDEKRARKEKKFKEKLTDLKRKTRTEAFRRQAAKGAAGGPTKFGDAVSGGKHVHEWGRTVENEEGMTVKTCVGCGMEVEELEF
ncbi:Putative glutamate synthase [NADPH] [Verticillium dahliae VDG2]|nr:Putative glutamate synthase [NADPH] [Verticillium dahliae VDG2]